MIFRFLLASIGFKANSKQELNEIAGFDKVESKPKNGAQESDNFSLVVFTDVRFLGIKSKAYTTT